MHLKHSIGSLDNRGIRRSKRYFQNTSNFGLACPVYRSRYVLYAVKNMTNRPKQLSNLKRLSGQMIKAYNALDGRRGSEQVNPFESGHAGSLCYSHSRVKSFQPKGVHNAVSRDRESLMLPLYVKYVNTRHDCVTSCG
jgi:hypothetical protein